MQINSLHEMPKPVSGKIKKNISRSPLLKILPRVLLSVKGTGVYIPGILFLTVLK